MSARSLNWLKFGGLVALAFALGLLFAGLLDLPSRSSAQEQGRQASAIAPVPAPSIPAARPLQELSEAFAAVAEHVKPSVVYIRSQRTEHASQQQQRVPPGMERFFSPRFRQQPEIEQGSGSGLHHLGRRLHPDQQPRRRRRRAGDGPAARPARVQGQGHRHRSQHRRRRAQDRRQGRCRPWRWATATTPGSGEWVLAIGNPLGEGLTFTVTSRHRERQGPRARAASRAGARAASRTSSRPTPPSIRATPAARW